MVNRPTSSRRSVAFAIVIPLLAFIALAAWAFSSSVASSPDDDFHLPAIWCGLGEREGLCENPGDSVQRLVPTPIIHATCYAFRPEVSGDCWDPDAEGLSRAERANADGLYPPLFYAAMSTLATTDVPSSVLAMRIMNSAFAVGLLTGVFFALPRRLRPALLVSILATAVPLGMFLLASTNPSSWAILSAATVWICLYGAMLTTGRRRYVLTALAVFGGVIGAGARADSAAFAVFGVIIAVILGLRPVRHHLVPTVGAGVIVAISAFFYLTSGQSGAASAGLAGNTVALTPAQHVANFLGVPGLWAGALGKSGLGWLDTVLPDTVWVLTLSVFAGALFIGLTRIDARRVIAISLTLLSLWIVPFALLAQSRAIVGTQVQPRYLLPLMVLAAGVAALRFDAERAWRNMRFVLSAVALSVALTISLQFNIRRYTTGLDENAIDPGASAEWWWTLAPPPLLIWILGVGSFAGMLTLLWFTLSPEVRSDQDAISASPAITEETSPR